MKNKLYTIIAYIIAMCIFSLPITLEAQQMVNYNFANWLGPGGGDPGDCSFFMEAQLPNWINASGTPQWLPRGHGHSDYVQMVDNNISGDFGYEAIAGSYNFMSGYTYVLRIGLFFFQGYWTSTCYGTLMAFATNGVPETPPPSPPLGECQGYIPTPASNQLIARYEPTAPVSNQVLTVVFKPDANYSQILLYGLSCRNEFALFALDSVSIESCVNGTIDYTATSQLSGGVMTEYSYINAGSGVYGSIPFPIVDVDPNHTTLFMGKAITLVPSFLAQMKSGNYFLAQPINGCIDCGSISSSLQQDAGEISLCNGLSTTFTSTSPGGTWSSSNPAVITIDPSTGVATGISAGGVNITYTLGSCVTIASLFESGQCDKDGRLIAPSLDTSLRANTSFRSEAVSFNIFPNPTEDNITITYPCQSAGQLEITIQDVDSRTIYSQSVSCTDGSSAQQVVDMSTFTPGVYFVNLTLNEQHVVKKVVKL